LTFHSESYRIRELVDEEIMRGAPFGNTNAQKGKVWNDSLRRAIASDQGARVLKAAQRLLDEASNGEPWAIKELADRLDGKPSQETVIDTTMGNLPHHIQISFVTPIQKLSIENQ
jgi:hypothetical protein